MFRFWGVFTFWVASFLLVGLTVAPTLADDDYEPSAGVDSLVIDWKNIHQGDDALVTGTVATIHGRTATNVRLMVEHLDDHGRVTGFTIRDVREPVAFGAPVAFSVPVAKEATAYRVSISHYDWLPWSGAAGDAGHGSGDDD